MAHRGSGRRLRRVVLLVPLVTLGSPGVVAVADVPPPAPAPAMPAAPRPAFPGTPQEPCGAPPAITTVPYFASGAGPSTTDFGAILTSDTAVEVDSITLHVTWTDGSSGGYTGGGSTRLVPGQTRVVILGSMDRVTPVDYFTVQVDFHLGDYAACHFGFGWIF